MSEQEYMAAKELGKGNHSKEVYKRLQVIILHYEGKNLSEIAEKLDLHKCSISRMLNRFHAVGLEEYARLKYTSHNHSLTWDEENTLLQEFSKKAETGQLVTVKEIKAVFDLKRGKDTGSKYIYDVLKRHKWRKILPRSKHPQKATEETISSTKILTAPYWMPPQEQVEKSD